MKKILFFDDEPYISRYLINGLIQISRDNNYEWEISFISSVKDLLKEINNSAITYDLFILDVMVPIQLGETKSLLTETDIKKMNNGMSTGLVMAEKIRCQSCYKTVPILYLSARLIPPIPEEERHYTAYIRKPEAPDNIAKEINKLLL